MRFAYVSPDGVLRVHDLTQPDSEDAVVSVPGMRCTWPLWSAGGGLIAFSGYVGGSNGNARLGVYATDLDGSDPGLIYSNEPGTDGIARGTPHYFSWSPDGGRLGFVSQTGNGLTLYLWNPAQDELPKVMLDGGPLYFSWSPHSTEMYVHSFTDHYMIGTSGDADPRQFPGLSTQYMSPSWDSNGGRIAFFLDGDRSRQRLVAIDLENQAVKVLTELSGVAAAAWRPNSSQVSVVRAMIGSTGFYSGLSTIDYETGEEHQITEDPVLAYYWSPDGSRVAYVTSSENAEGSLRFGVVTPDTGDAVYLADFRPSQEQLTHFMYFDQYAQSQPLWSPDGSTIMIFGELGYHVDRTPLSSGDSNSAIILDPTGQAEPREAATGFIGCWEPR